MLIVSYLTDERHHESLKTMNARHVQPLGMPRCVPKTPLITEVNNRLDVRQSACQL